MNNNLISKANELLEKYALTGDRHYFIEAAEKNLVINCKCYKSYKFDDRTARCGAVDKICRSP